MKRIWILLLFLGMATGAPACSPDDAPAPEIPEQPGVPGENPNPGEPENPGENDEHMKIRITAGSAVFTATLADNATAKAFRALLPLTLDMGELNRNEKYAGLPQSLPTSASNPGTIRNGDIMLYGSGTLVLFYKSFASSYSYSRIGAVDQPAGWEEALGTGSISVRFESIEN